MGDEVKQQTPTGAPVPQGAPNSGGPTHYQRIYREIEYSADYYEPSIYGALTYCQQLELTDDPLIGDFVPVSPTAYKLGDSSCKGLMFVVGLLPPTSNISGRLIDRSGTVGAMLGTGEVLESGDLQADAAASVTGGYIVTAPGYTIPTSSSSANIGEKTPGGEAAACNGQIAIAVDKENPKQRHWYCVTSMGIRAMYQGLYDAYKRLFNREPTATEIQFLTAHCWRETSGNLPGNNPGMIGNKCGSYPGGEWAGFEHKDGTVCWFRTYKDTAAGFDAYLKIAARNPNVLAAARQGDILGFLTSLAQTGYYGEPLDLYYNNYGRGGGYPALLSMVAGQIPEAGLGRGDRLPNNVPDACAFKETTDQYRERTKNQTKDLPNIERNGKSFQDPAVGYRFNRNSPYGADCPLEGNAPFSGDDSTHGWSSDGSNNAKANRKEEDKLEQVRAVREELGKRFQQAQAAYIRAAQAALDTMKRMPPLRMLVNPTQFTVTCEKIVSDGNRSRTGNIIEHWGDGQDKIQGQGTIAGFYSIDASDARGPGLTRTARNWSLSYQNFLSLWLLYRNNGGIWLPENMGPDSPASTSLTTLGSIYIYYDGVLYLGSFDSFDITESDDKPHSLEYSFSFTVRAWFLLDRRDEGDFDYGAAAFFRVSNTVPAVQSYADRYEAELALAAQRREQARKQWEEKQAETDKNDPARIYGLGTFGPPMNSPPTGARTAGGTAPRGNAGTQSGARGSRGGTSAKPAVPTNSPTPAAIPPPSGEPPPGATGWDPGTGTWIF